ncbi:hypothetical protein PEDI_09050 [Persicobacter diffluens]|uniref:Uncharacterized protein n=2 Tax=Persicobacter diffluens TaxID=981 RepID=A0AAN4VVB6_9BACT|nr:hypothetical protein PEDI_09050 [Persicobacter diffluens]
MHFKADLFLLKFPFSCKAGKMKGFSLFQVFYNEVDEGGEIKPAQIWAIIKSVNPILLSRKYIT